jgi:kinesin family member 5
MTEDPKKKKSERITVYVRIRPLNDDETRTSDKESIIDQIDTSKNIIIVKKDSDRKQFTYDYIFDQFSIQKNVYLKVGKPVVDSVLEGYNSTILAYGQTGTGKTHTMIGGPGELKGIIPRCMKQIFSSIKKSTSHNFDVKVGFLQLYMEVLHDLIRPDINNPIRIREDTDEGIYLSGLTWINVASVSDCMNLLATGDRNRNVASTSMNSSSSRSHAVYMVKIEKRAKHNQEDFELEKKDESMTKSTLYLVDLAGSERVSKTKVSGSRLDEAKNINLALLALGNCIQALTEGKSRYIPFRDSKLTRILEDSLGGNSKTSLIITIGPSVSNYQESVSSLLFATRAMKIQNTPELNIKIDYKALCAQLQSELDKINDNKNITNIDINKLLEENNALKESIEKLSSEKIQLESMLEELKKGTDVSAVEGNTTEFYKIKRYYKKKFEKQEEEHKRFIKEIDKMLLDQEEQLNSLKNSNKDLENSNALLSSELKKCQIELEQERNDRELRAGQMINEIEDLKQKLHLEQANSKTAHAEIEKIKGENLKKLSSTGNLNPIKMRPTSPRPELADLGELVEKIRMYEVMIHDLEEDLIKYERKYEMEVSAHKETQNMYSNEVKKLQKQQAKLVKAYKGLEKKSELDIRSLQGELDRQSISQMSKLSSRP